jgi:hypothetical protein
MMRNAALLALLAFVPVFGQVEVRKAADGRIDVAIDGKPFTSLYYGNDFAKPFLAPLRTASGLAVTRRFPMEKVAGESNDHPHHRGLWIGFGEINGFNFWENELNYTLKQSAGKPAGHLVTRKIDKLSSGKKTGAIEATIDWNDPSGKPVLTERRRMVFSGGTDVRIVDLDLWLTANVDAKFADTKEGFLGIRVADSMTEKNGGLITNSQGQQTETKIWGQPSDWVDYDGTVEGEKVGIVVFDHQDNLNHPVRLHTRAYGLLALNPFGLKSFVPASATEGGYLLPAGKTLRFRYRVIVHPGDVPEQKIAAWYADYKAGRQ